MDKKVVLIVATALVLGIVVVHPVGADDTATIGAIMVKNGLEFFMYGVGDSIFSMGVGNENNSSSSTNSTLATREEAPNMIFKMLTFTINPYEFSFVVDWQRVMIIFFVMMTAIAVISGAISVIIGRSYSDLVSPITHLFGSQVFNIRMWLHLVVDAIILLIFSTFGLYYLFVLEYVISAMIANGALAVAPPTIDNVVIYILFASVYLLFTLVMAVRTIIIILMAAGALGLAALYLIPQTKEFAASAFMYFVVVLFMQPALLFIAAVGLAFVKIVPLPLIGYQVTLVLALTIFMLIFSLVCILGKGIFRTIIWVGARVVI